MKHIALDAVGDKPCQYSTRQHIQPGHQHNSIHCVEPVHPVLPLSVLLSAGIERSTEHEKSTKGLPLSITNITWKLCMQSK